MKEKGKRKIIRNIYINTIKKQTSFYQTKEIEHAEAIQQVLTIY